MENSLSKIVAMIIAGMLLFIYPIMNAFLTQDETARLFVESEVTTFVDTVRNLGYIKPEMYL